MKKILLFAFVLGSFFAKAQELDVTPLQWSNESLIYQEVMEVEGVSKEAIYTGIKKHLISAFKNYDKVVQVENQEMGVFSGRAIATVPFETFPTGTWNIYYNFEIDIKDGKFRATYKSFEETDTGYPLELYTKNTLTGNYVKKLRGPARDVIPNLGLHFEDQVMKMKNSIVDEDDW